MAQYLNDFDNVDDWMAARLRTRSHLVRSIMVLDTFSNNLSLSAAQKKKLLMDKNQSCTIAPLVYIAVWFAPACHCDLAQYWTNFKDIWSNQSIRHKCMGKWGPG